MGSVGFNLKRKFEEGKSASGSFGRGRLVEEGKKERNKKGELRVMVDIAKRCRLMGGLLATMRFCARER